MSVTNIEWTDRVWNPVTGCRKVSPGCKQCYAEGVAHRFWATQYPAVEVETGGPAGTMSRARAFTDVMTHEDRLLEPLRWKKPTRVFVNSMSDLFHEDVPDEFIDRVFHVMQQAERHTFQVLTKRADRLRAYAQGMASLSGQERGARVLTSAGWSTLPREVSGDGFPWPLPNVWLGVSVEDQQRADERIPLLLQTPAAVRFISAEPLLGLVDIGLSQAVCGCCPRIFSSRWVRVNRRLQADFPLNIVGDRAGMSIEPGVHRAISNRHGALSVNSIGIRPSEFDTLPALDWVIVGGESGPGARPCHEAWVRSIVQQCQAAGTPVFVKQLGAFPIWSLSDGRPANGEGGTAQAARTVAGALNPKCADPSEWPEELRVREFPR